MSSRRALVLAALLAVPSLLPAQKTRAASGRDKSLMSEPDRDQRSMITPHDLDDQSPIKLLIDKRKDLKLSDAQLSTVKDVDAKVRDKNKSLFRSVDSLNREMRPPAGEMTDEFRAKLRTAREELTGTIKDIRDNYDAAVKEVLPALDDEQRTKAADLLEKHRADVEKAMRDKQGRSDRP